MVAAVPANVLEKIVARVPVGRLGKAEEIARGVSFVAENAGFITGSTLPSTAASTCTRDKSGTLTHIVMR